MTLQFVYNNKYMSRDSVFEFNNNNDTMAYQLLL